MTSNNEALYKAKQDWLDRLFASELTPATKCFAWGVFKRMYGVKIVSNPGSNTIYDDTKVGKSKHSDHRKKLAGCGAMSMKLVKNDKGDWDSYEYTLNLHWDGNGAFLIEGSNPQGTTPEIDSSATSEGSYPEGTTLPPTGYEGTTQRVGGVLPTGSSNTINNTTKKTVTNTLKNTPPAAAESVISDSKEDVDDSPLLVVNEDSPLSVVTDSAFDVVKSNAADDVENGPAEEEDEEVDWEDFDAFADYEPTKEEVPMKSQTESLTFGEWFDSLQEGTVKDVAAFGIIHRKFHGQEKIKAVAIKSVDSEFDWCDNPVMRYTYAALELQDMPDSGGRAANDTDQDEW